MRRSNRAGHFGAPLRVGLVVGNFPVISETFVINQAAGLVDRGHDVRILSMDGQRQPESPMHEAVDRFDLLARSYRPMAGSILLKPFASAGNDPSSDWSVARRLCAFAAQAGMTVPRRRFDILHCQFASFGLEIEGLAKLNLLRYRKLVLHLRGSDVSRFVQEKGTGVYRSLFGKADLLIANCEYFRQRAIDLGAPPQRVIVIGSAIDCDRFPLVQRDRKKHQSPRLVAIGRLVEKKGYEYAIRGFAAIAAEHPGATFDIIGDGPLRAELQALIDGLGMSDKVNLVGSKPQSQVREYLTKADIMVASSVRASSGDEDAPVNSLKEGMATGLPVVASRHGGIPELVEDGVHGYLVDERSPAQIADALRHLLAEPERWPAMGQEGREKVVRIYHLPRVIDQIEAAYRGLMNGQDGRQ